MQCSYCDGDTADKDHVSWPHGEEDEDQLSEEQIGYTTAVTGGAWTLTVLVRVFSPEGRESFCAFTPFQEQSETAVVEAAKRRWPDLNVIPKHEWDKVFFKRWGGGDRPGSGLGGTGQRVATFGRTGGGPRGVPASGTPGLSAAGLPPDWGTRSRSVSRVQTGSNSARASASKARVTLESIKDFSLDEWVPVVQCAKRLGYPPQYLYNAVYHGKIKTQGERPKKALWKDILSKYRPDLLKELLSEERKEPATD